VTSGIQSIPGSPENPDCQTGHNRVLTWESDTSHTTDIATTKRVDNIDSMQITASNALSEPAKNDSTNRRDKDR
jgi:hypothetical protein